MADRQKITSATAIDGSSSSEIAIAAATHTREFAIYVAVGVVVAIVLAILTWRVWKSGNRVQDAIRHDANARIEEARRDLKKLELENLRVKSDLALLEKAATDAKAAQQRVEIDLAKQQALTAVAQRDLLALQETVKPRSITPEQREKFLEILAPGPKGAFNLVAVADDAEAGAFADEIGNLLIRAGWTASSNVSGRSRHTMGATPRGIIIEGSSESQRILAAILTKAFESIGFKVRSGLRIGADPPRPITVLVGTKP